MENNSGKNDLLRLHSDVIAKPDIHFIKADGQTVEIHSSTGGNKETFKINLDIALPYEALSKVANGYLADKRFDISEGFINKHVIIEKCRLFSSMDGNLIIEVDFGGSYNGTAIFNGTPYYNAAAKRIEIQHLEYDLKTNNFLLKAARWLFDKRILSEIKKYTAFDMTSYYTIAREKIQLSLNKEWGKGIRATGVVSEITLDGVYPQQEHLLIRGFCTGGLRLAIDETRIGF